MADSGVTATAGSALIALAGLDPEHIRITGYAPACDGEPELLTGVFLTTRAFLIVRAWKRYGMEGATAEVSAAIPGVEPTEMERERLLAESKHDDESYPEQRQVIAMVKAREAGPSEQPNVLEASAVEVPVDNPPDVDLLAGEESDILGAGGEWA